MKIFACTNCDYHSVTSKYTCPKCQQGKLQETEVSPKGTVYSFTDIHVAPAEFAHIAPYTVALIQLDKAPVKVTARMDGEVTIGDAVELKGLEEGAFIYTKQTISSGPTV
ncbi:Zn-ribbon domain-containing OB-fold protein [Sporosarcina cyprini]|uniref:Zn-ribbon domain-containing OB-fold protein n=1 Tax=Sporosarcina cyprini TaxID=2910523 RepID=UPI001EDF65F1|nr:OB-fold domain-containing protein [Sporosarcina cyprini]MCG3088160.1 OB-fold domain-containing protein [Sporosarcina cyprini]